MTKDQATGEGPDEPSTKRAASSEAKALFYTLIFFGSFLAHDFLQETIIRSEGWNFPLFMTLLEFGSCCAFSFILEKPLASADPPIKSYAALTSTVLSSAVLANISLGYVNYPVKVVFKSTKLLGAMCMSFVILTGKKFQIIEFVAAGFLCGGLILFILADASGGGKTTTTTGKARSVFMARKQLIL